VNTKLLELGRRRESLVARSAIQREQLGHAYRRIKTPAVLLHTAGGILRIVKTYPALTTSLTAAFVGARRRRLGKLALILGTGLLARRRLRAWWPRRPS
jgi:hypothetical protein